MANLKNEEKGSRDRPLSDYVWYCLFITFGFGIFRTISWYSDMPPEELASAVKSGQFGSVIYFILGIFMLIVNFIVFGKMCQDAKPKSKNKRGAMRCRTAQGKSANLVVDNYINSEEDCLSELDVLESMNKTTP